MKPIDDFLPLILPRAPGCPEPIAFDAIRQAAIEFCERTRIWRDTDQFMADEFGDIFAPAQSVVYQIEDARFDGRRLTPIGVQDLNGMYPDCDWTTKTGEQPQYVTQLHPDTIKVVPSMSGMVTLTMLLKPTNNAQELPDFIFDQYARTIADGALAEILMIPGQPYTNPQGGAMYSQRFQQRLDSLQVQGLKGQQCAPIHTKASFF